jgi:hypothetical protein
MKALVLMTTIVATVSLLALPAEAVSKKRKNAPATRAPVTIPHPHPHAVYESDGTVLGMDPDPFIRIMIRKDPRPWEGNF